MSVLTWWLIPVVATLGAIVVMSVANRTRGPGPSDRSVEEFQRFRTALEHQIHTPPEGPQREVANGEPRVIPRTQHAPND